MSYRPQEQSIEDPLRKILEGIVELDAAARKRAESRDWAEEHLEELDQLNIDLLRLRRRMIKMADEHW